METETVLELLTVANLYGQPQLQRLCEEYVQTGINDNNCVELLQFSLLHRAYLLKQTAIYFILRNYPNYKEEINNKLPEIIKKVII